jgi:hypothetical protein
VARLTSLVSPPVPFTGYWLALPGMKEGCSGENVLERER